MGVSYDLMGHLGVGRFARRMDCIFSWMGGTREEFRVWALVWIEAISLPTSLFTSVCKMLYPVFLLS